MSLQRGYGTASDGRQTLACSLVCDNCGGVTFEVWWLALSTGEHLHHQCDTCGTTFCDGTCKDGDVFPIGFPIPENN